MLNHFNYHLDNHYSSHGVWNGYYSKTYRRSYFPKIDYRARTRAYLNLKKATILAIIPVINPATVPIFRKFFLYINYFGGL